MRRSSMVAAVLAGNLILRIAHAQTADDSGSGALLTKINVVDFAKPDAAWSAAGVGQSLSVRDRLRTGEDSRATVRMSDLSVLRLDELTTIEILPPKGPRAEATLNLKQGSTYFFSREKSREQRIETPSANGAIRGTEFLLVVTQQLRTIVAMLSGAFELSNSQGAVVVRGGEQAEAGPNSKPTKRAISDELGSIPWRLLIELKLPPNKTLISASKPEVLAAVCAAVKEWPQVASQIIGTAVEARKGFAQDILRTAIQCLGTDDCDLIVRIVTAVVRADPDDASMVIELALQLAPECRGALERVGKGEKDGFGDPPVNVNPPPGAIGGGGAQETTVTICDQGINVQVPASQVERYLRTHPGSRLGPCEVTPVTNR